MFSSISRSFAVVMTFAILAAAMPGGSPPPAKTTTVTVTAVSVQRFEFIVVRYSSARSSQPAPTSTPASACTATHVQTCQSLDTVCTPTELNLS